MTVKLNMKLKVLLGFVCLLTILEIGKCDEKCEKMCHSEPINEKKYSRKYSQEDNCHKGNNPNKEKLNFAICECCGSILHNFDRFSPNEHPYSRYEYSTHSEQTDSTEFCRKKPQFNKDDTDNSCNNECKSDYCQCNCDCDTENTKSNSYSRNNRNARPRHRNHYMGIHPDDTQFDEFY